MGTSSLKVSPSKSGYNNNNKAKMNGYGGMYGAGFGDLSAYNSYGGMNAYGQAIDPSAYSAAAGLGGAPNVNLAAYAGAQPGIGSYPPPPPYQATPAAAAAPQLTAQQLALAGYQQQQAAVPVADPNGAGRQQTTFSSLNTAEQDALLKQIGIDRSQVATNVQMQPAAPTQQQQQYQYVIPQHQPVSAAPVQQPIEHQQQYLPVPEAPPHYSNRYSQPREAQGQPAQVVYQQLPPQAHQLPQRQIQTPPPPQYVYERYTPPPPPLRRDYSYPKHQSSYRPYQNDRVYYPPREATIDEILDFLPPRPGVYQARPAARQRLSPLSRDLVYSRPRRVIDDDYDGYVLESRYMKRRPSLSIRSKSHDCCPPQRARAGRFYSDEDFYSDYSDYSDY